MDNHVNEFGLCQYLMEITVTQVRTSLYNKLKVTMKLKDSDINLMRKKKTKHLQQIQMRGQVRPRDEELGKNSRYMTGRAH